VPPCSPGQDGTDRAAKSKALSLLASPICRPIASAICQFFLPSTAPRCSMASPPGLNELAADLDRLAQRATWCAARCMGSKLRGGGRGVGWGPDCGRHRKFHVPALFRAACLARCGGFGIFAAVLVGVWVVVGRCCSGLARGSVACGGHRADSRRAACESKPAAGCWGAGRLRN
jgi:hypothetical protein